MIRTSDWRETWNFIYFGLFKRNNQVLSKSSKQKIRNENFVLIGLSVVGQWRYHGSMSLSISVKKSVKSKDPLGEPRTGKERNVKNRRDVS